MGAAMVHLRTIAPESLSGKALDLLLRTRSVTNVITLPGSARDPGGDLLLCDVAREDASVVVSSLQEIGVTTRGSIAVIEVASEISERADAASRAARGYASDAVVWEEVSARASEEADISGSFVTFLVLAGLIAGVAIYLNSAIMLVGAMAVGPEFGPIAGLSIAIVQRRPVLALRSALALAIGFPLAMLAVLAETAVFHRADLLPHALIAGGTSIEHTIASPGVLVVFVAVCAGIAGVLSLTTSKSSALVGVAVSVTTIPAAANAAIAAELGRWGDVGGSLAQLGTNIAGLLAGGIVTLLIQRRLYARRRAEHARVVSAS